MPASAILEISWTQLSGFTVNLRIIYGCPPKISASLLYLLIQALDVSDVLYRHLRREFQRP